MKNATFASSYDFVKKLIEGGTARRIFDVIDYHFVSKNDIEYSDNADLIFELIAKYGEGFVVDICSRVRKENIRLSDKQRWCIAFALLKISIEMVDSLKKENEAIITEENGEGGSSEIKSESEKITIKLYHGSATPIETVKNDRPMYLTPDINIAKQWALGLDDLCEYNEDAYIYEMDVDVSEAVVEEDSLYFTGAGDLDYLNIAEITFCPECGEYLIKHPSSSLLLVEHYKNSL